MSSTNITVTTMKILKEKIITEENNFVSKRCFAVNKVGWDNLIQYLEIKCQEDGDILVDSIPFEERFGIINNVDLIEMSPKLEAQYNTIQDYPIKEKKESIEEIFAGWDEMQLKPNLQEGKDYVLIPHTKWLAIKYFFGAFPQIGFAIVPLERVKNNEKLYDEIQKDLESFSAKKCPEGYFVDKNPIVVKIKIEKNLQENNFIKMLLSKYLTLKEAIHIVCEGSSLPYHNCELTFIQNENDPTVRKMYDPAFILNEVPISSESYFEIKQEKTNNQTDKINAAIPLKDNKHAHFSPNPPLAIAGNDDQDLQAAIALSLQTFKEDQERNGIMTSGNHNHSDNNQARTKTGKTPSTGASTPDQIFPLNQEEAAAERFSNLLDIEQTNHMTPEEKKEKAEKLYYICENLLAEERFPLEIKSLEEIYTNLCKLEESFHNYFENKMQEEEKSFHDRNMKIVNKNNN